MQGWAGTVGHWAAHRNSSGNSLGSSLQAGYPWVCGKDLFPGAIGIKIQKDLPPRRGMLGYLDPSSLWWFLMSYSKQSCWIEDEDTKGELLPFSGIQR